MILASACAFMEKNNGSTGSEVIPNSDVGKIDDRLLSARTYESDSPDMAPDFSIRFYQTGNLAYAEVSTLYSILSMGDPIVLNFWAGLCPPCRMEMNDMESAYGVSTGEVILMGIDIGQFVLLGTEEDAKRLLLELDITYPTGTTMDSGIVEAYRIFGMPTTIFIRSDGTIHRRWTGALNSSKLSELIEELIEGP